MKAFPAGFGCRRKCPASIGVRLSERPIDTTTAALSVSPNSRIRSPTTPPMNIRGVKTAMSEIEMVMIVKAISPAPASAASNGFTPCSMRRQITSSMTMASSTTKPTAIDMAISDRLSRLKPAASITAVVPSSEIGITIAGMSVARTSRRNRKITPVTRKTVSSSVSSTSRTEARMVCVRSATMCMSMDGGMSAFSPGSAALIRLTVWMTFAPGCLKMIRRTARPPFSVGSSLAAPG